MTLQRLDFKEFDAVMVGESLSGQRIFQAASPPKEVIPPPPVFSENQFRAAEALSYRKGFLDGLREGRAAAENEQTQVSLQLTATIESLVQKLAPLYESYRTLLGELSHDMPKLALAIAQKVAGPALDHTAHEVILSTVTRACETMMDEPKLTITVNETIADALALGLKNLADRMPAATHIIIMRSPDLPISDCKVEWEHGAIERSTEQLWQTIEKKVDELADAQKRESDLRVDAMCNTNENQNS